MLVEMDETAALKGNSVWKTLRMLFLPMSVLDPPKKMTSLPVLEFDVAYLVETAAHTGLNDKPSRAVFGVRVLVVSIAKD